MKQAERSARRRHTVNTIAVVLVLMSFGFREARAQQATSFEQLKLLLEPGDTVTVTESSGQITKGKIEALTGSSLRLVAGGGVELDPRADRHDAVGGRQAGEPARTPRPSRRPVERHRARVVEGDGRRNRP